jgi:hypothetical protein
MGTDIHCFIEFCANDHNYWHSLGEQIIPTRDYEIFDRLAGVREEGPLVPLRGMPEDAGYFAKDYNRLEISEIGEADVDWYRTAEEAKEYVDRGDSAYVYGRDGRDGRDGKPIAVTHPDWHSHSWVTPDEWETAIQVDQPKAVPEYRAMLAAMRELEQMGYQCRVVFWLDD